MIKTSEPSDKNVPLTLFQPEGGGGGYAYHISVCSAVFENLTTSLQCILVFKRCKKKGVCVFILLLINKSECNVNESIFNVSLPKTSDTITDKKKYKSLNPKACLFILVFFEQLKTIKVEIFLLPRG
jgi:hypothetical protein